MNDSQIPSHDVAKRRSTGPRARPQLVGRWAAALLACTTAMGCALERFEALTDAGNTSVQTSDDQAEPSEHSDDVGQVEAATEGPIAADPDAGHPGPTTPTPSDPRPAMPSAQAPTTTTPAPSSPITTVPAADAAAPQPATDASASNPDPKPSADSAGAAPPVTTPDAEGGAPPEPTPSIAELVDDYESGAITLETFTLGASANRPVLPPGPLSQLPEGAVLLGPGEYTIDADLLVSEGTVLVLAGGTRLSLASGVSLTVMGQVYALGTPSAPVAFDGAGDGFAEITLGGGRSELHGCSVRNGQTLLRVNETFAAPIEIDDCALDDWTANGVVLSLAENVWLHDSKLGTATAGAAASSAVVAKNSTFVLQNNKVGAMAPTIDSFDLDDCTEGATSYVLGNALDQGGQDALAVSNCRMVIANNRIKGFDSDPELCSCLEAKTNARLLVVGNLLYNCADGLIGNNDAYVLLLNNSVVGSARGVHLLDTSRVDIVGNIFWDNTRDLSVEANAAATVEHNIIDASGTANIVVDPLFESRGGLDYYLAPGSPARARDYAYAEQIADGTPFEPSEIAETLGLDLAGTPRLLPTIDFGALQQ